MSRIGYLYIKTFTYQEIKSGSSGLLAKTLKYKYHQLIDPQVLRIQNKILLNW